MTFSSVLPVFLIVVADMMAMMMMVPVLPFFAERFGATPLTVGLLSASFAACQLLAAPLMGRWSDHIGRRPVLLVSQLGTLLGLLILAWSNSLWLLFLGRMLDGATAGNLAIAQACLADATPAKDRARAFGILGVAFGIGLVCGPALSAALIPLGWEAPFFAAAGFSGLSLVATYFLLRPGPPVTARNAETRPAETPSQMAGLLSRPGWKLPWAQFALFSIAFGFFSQGLGLFLERAIHTPAGVGWGPKEVGLYFAVSGVFGIMLQGVLMGKLTRKFGEPLLARGAFLFSAVGYLWLGPARSSLAAWGALCFFAVGNSLLRPVLTSGLSQRGGAHQQGHILGTAASLQSAGMVIGPLLGGMVLEVGQLSAWGYTLAVLSFGGLFLQRPTK